MDEVFVTEVCSAALADMKEKPFDYERLFGKNAHEAILNKICEEIRKHNIALLEIQARLEQLGTAD